MRWQIDGRFFSALLTFNCLLMMHLAGSDILSYREVWIATATQVMVYSAALVASWLAYRRSNKKLAAISQQPVTPEVAGEPEEDLGEDSSRPV